MTRNCRTYPFPSTKESSFRMLLLAGVCLSLVAGGRGQAATVNGTVTIPASDTGWTPSPYTMHGASVRVEGTTIEAALTPTGAATAEFALEEVPQGTVTLILDEGSHDAGGDTPYDIFTLSSKRVSVIVDRDSIDGVSFTLAYHWQELAGYPLAWGSAGYGEWTPHFVSDQVGFLFFRVRSTATDPERMELYRTLDGGGAWSEIGHWEFDATAFAAGTPYPAWWRRFHFQDADRGVVLAAVGCIPCAHCGSGFFHTDDGGSTWQYTALPPPGIAYAIDVQKYATTGVDHLIAAGTVGCGVQGYRNGFYDAVWESGDGGAVWTRVWESDINQKGGIQALGASATGAAVAFRGWPIQEFLHRDPIGVWATGSAGGLNVVSYDLPMAGDTAWLVEGYGTEPAGVYRSDDSGHTWQHISDSVVQSFGYGSSRKGFAQAGGPAYVTYDGGASWAYQSAGGAVVEFNQVWAFDATHAIWTEGGYYDPNDRSQLFTYLEPLQADFEIVESVQLAHLEVQRPQTEIPMASWTLRNNGPMGLNLNRLSLSASGTGDDPIDLESVAVWLDPEGDAALGTLDVRLGTGAYSSDDGTAMVALDTGLELHPLTPVHLLVTYDLSNGLNNLKTFSFTLSPDGVYAETADEGTAVLPTAPSGHAYTSRTLTFLAYADLETRLTCAPDPVTAGNEATYRATVINHGPNDAAGVSLKDSLPSSFSFVSVAPSQGTCAHALGMVECMLGDLAVGETAQVTLIVTPMTDGRVVNAVTTTATEVDPNGSNDTASVAATVDPAPAGGGGGGGGCFLATMGESRNTPNNGE